MGNPQTVINKTKGTRKRGQAKSKIAVSSSGISNKKSPKDVPNKSATTKKNKAQSEKTSQSNITNTGDGMYRDMNLNVPFNHYQMHPQHHLASQTSFQQNHFHSHPNYDSRQQLIQLHLLRQQANQQHHYVQQQQQQQQQQHQHLTPQNQASYITHHLPQQFQILDQHIPAMQQYRTHLQKIEENDDVS